MSTEQKPRQSPGGVPDLSTVDAFELIEHVGNAYRRITQLERMLAGIVLPERGRGPYPQIFLPRLEAAWTLANDLIDDLVAIKVDLGANAKEVTP